jgi:hypothetical protein
MQRRAPLVKQLRIADGATIPAALIVRCNSLV